MEEDFFHGVSPASYLPCEHGVIGTEIAHNDSWRPTEILYHSLNGKGQA